MYGIFTSIWLKVMINVGKYSIKGVYLGIGVYDFSPTKGRTSLDFFVGPIFYQMSPRQVLLVTLTGHWTLLDFLKYDDVI